LKEITFPSHFRISGLNSLLGKWEDACSSLDKEIFLDLKNVYYFTPFGACFLAALVRELVNLGKSGGIRFPTRPTARHQFEYLGLPEHFGRRVPKRSPMVPTVGLRRLTQPDYDYAFKLAGLVAESLGSITRHSLYAVQLGSKELLQNAFEHAESEDGVYVCAGGVKTKRTVRICVLDRGIGIRRHLARNPMYRRIQTDEEAIRKCTRINVTGVPDKTRGLGLYFLSRIVEDSGGHIQIASGNALLTFEGRQLISSQKLEREFRGTIVEIFLKATRQYRFKLDDYEEGLF
jgi:anti-sigma regulatory factor (Ser/Thr protein kinase)